MAKERWLSAVAITALALGIGVNATVFAMVNAVLVRGLPFDESQNLYVLAWKPKRGEWRRLSYRELQEWRAQTRAFGSIAAWSGADMNISDDLGLPEQARGVFVTANAFSVLRQPPLLGRDFRPEEERRGSERPVMPGYQLWKTRYAGDPTVVGESIRLNGEPAVIVGVMPEGMHFPQNTDVWSVFVPTNDQLSGRRGRWKRSAVCAMG